VLVQLFYQKNMIETELSVGSMSPMACFRIYNRIAYYAMIRGESVYFATSPFEMEKNVDAFNSAVVSVLSVKYKLVFDKPMLFALMMADTYQKVLKLIEGKTFSDFGLSPRFEYEGSGAMITLRAIPHVQYSSSVHTILETEREAFDAYSSGAKSIHESGKIVQFRIPPPVEDTAANDVVEIEENVEEEGGFVERCQSLEGESSVVVVVPSAQQVQKRVGTISSYFVVIEIWSPGRKPYYKETNYEGVQIIAQKYKYACRIKMHYWLTYKSCPLFYDDQLRVMICPSAQLFPEIKTIFRMAYKVLMELRIKRGGSTRFTRNLMMMIECSKYPYRMPFREVAIQVANIAMDRPMQWIEYGCYAKDWRYNMQESFIGGYKNLKDYTFLDFEEDEFFEDWTQYGSITYEELDEILQFRQDCRFIYEDYKDYSIMDEDIERFWDQLAEQRLLDGIEEEEFEKSCDSYENFPDDEDFDFDQDSEP